MEQGWARSGAPHIPPGITVGGVMRQVLYALLPGIAVHVWLFGPGLLVHIVIATAFALFFEALALSLRGREVARFLGDGSAVVTAVLFALCIPPLAPWWIGLLGMFFAVVFAKHLYGGLGQNVFNPAMVGYVVALISFPKVMTQWLPPSPLVAYPLGLVDTLGVVFSGRLPDPLTWDGITQATPLDAIKTALHSGVPLPDIMRQPLFGQLGGTGWQWLATAYAAGGLFLLYKRIIGWQVPGALLGIVGLLSLAAWALQPTAQADPWQHLFSASLMLGAFFIATDPVTGCTSPLGRVWFGAGVGLITLVIRRWGGYPDGVAFAVLLMNMAAPVIDRYTRPRVYGQ